MEQREFLAQWDLEALPACESGMILLERFAEAHPGTYRTLQPSDFAVPDRPDLTMFPEWLTFAQHHADCDDCNEV